MVEHIVSIKKRSIKAFWQLNGLLIALVCLIIVNFGFVKSFYFSPNMPTIGHVVNGVIVTLTLLAVGRIAVMLWRLEAEERALMGFAAHLKAAPAGSNELAPLTAGINKETMIARRVAQIQIVTAQRAQPDQGALAALLLGEEQGTLSFFKFVNSVLILIGMLGTIMALAIALTGASSLIETLVDLKGMGVVVQGLSVALTTTFTALLCYLIHRYLFGLLVDSKMALIQAVERITALYLIPMFNVSEESLVRKYASLVDECAALLGKMKETQQVVQSCQDEVKKGIDRQLVGMDLASAGLERIEVTLKQGFRIG